MKKSLLVILLVLFAFMLWSSLAVAKDKPANTQKPAQIQKTEPNAGPESFPAQVLPRPHVKKSTPDDFRRALQSKNTTPEKEQAESQQQLLNQVLCPEPTAKELEPAMCRISNRVGACCYFYTAGTKYLACWGEVWIATLEDIEVNNYYTCSYPIYPLRVDSLSFQISAPDTCTFKVRAQIWSVDYSGGYPYPGTMLYANDTVYTWNHVGGYMRYWIKMPAGSCVNGPFYAMWITENTDDFQYVVGDTANYCGYAPYQFHTSWGFDQSGRKYQSYWGPYGEYGLPYGFLDVVENGITPGAISRLEAFTTPFSSANGCTPPAETWYFKEPYPPAAPCGVPDFDQKQMPAAFCGPTAAANSIWWFMARGDFDHAFSLNPANVPNLINEVAAASGTIPGTGTDEANLAVGIKQVIANHTGWWFTVTDSTKPSFWFIQKEVRRSQDVTLLLGFWQFDGTNWNRFGGHFVTVAGVDIFNLAFAFSDPAIDHAETGMGPGTVCGVHTPLNDPLDHNSGIASYDYYPAAWPSASPGGFVYLPDYVLNWPDFQGQNFKTGQTVATYNSSLPVVVEVENALVVCPGAFERTAYVDGLSAYEIESNFGGIEEWGALTSPADTLVLATTYAQCGSFYVGTSNSDMAGAGQNYYPTSAFFPTSAPTVDSIFVTNAYGGTYKIYQTTFTFQNPYNPCLNVTKYAFGFYPPAGGKQLASHFLEDVYFVKNTCLTPVNNIAKGIVIDLDGPSGGGDLAGTDQAHQSVWMTDLTDPNFHFGITQVPVGPVPITGYAINNTNRVWKDHTTWDSLYTWMTTLGWGQDVWTDYGFILADTLSLDPGAFVVNKYAKWPYYGAEPGPANADWRKNLYVLLQHEGYYRGDVNQDGRFDVADIIYTVNYCFRSGAKPIEFVDQGDVNNDGNTNVTDVIYMVNNRFKGGPYPIDVNRFLSISPFVDPAFKAAAIMNPGLFADPNWKNLGQ